MGRVRQILGFLRPYRRPLLLAAVLTAVLTFIGMAPPLVMRLLVNDVAQEGRWGIFPLLITLLLAVPVLVAAINIVNGIVRNRVAQGVIRDTRRRLFAHLMRLSMRFYDEQPVGAISQRLLGDVTNISTVVTCGLIELLADGIAVTFAVVVMLRLSPTLALLTLALLPLHVLNYRFFARRMQAANAALRSRMDHISSTLQEQFSAHELVQSYGQEKAQSQQFASQARQIMDAAVRGSAYSISFNQLSAFINKISNTVIYGAGCYAFVKGAMGYGDVVAFCAYATQLLGPVVRFLSLANQVVQVGVSVDRVQEILDREPAIQEARDAKPVPALKGDIDLDGVVFGEGTPHPVLRKVGLSIPAGTHVGLVGPTGAGRSTLAMLLRRFYDPTEGAVKADGRDIRELRLRDYRRAVALILPESAVFDGTIRDNLCYGRPDAPEDRMVEVARAVGLDDFVSGLSAGYDTRVGAGALRLSAGVQQQIGIARALISDPFVLIADEATASLDADTAQAIDESIREAMAGRTCILIYSRVLMAREADRVMVMDEGRIVEAGTHEELASTRDSLYRELFGRQYGDDRLPPIAGEDGA
jgi:ABC-type multidrug transport system fused ATPase/permease subunit